MNWLDKIETTKKTQFLIQEKTLTVSGITLTSIQKTIISKIPEIGENNYSNKSDDQKIAEYFLTTEEVNNFCNQAYEKCMDRFVIFSKHPDFVKFMKKIRESYNENWVYNKLILMKDLKFIKEMREILRNLIENPSQDIEFPKIPIVQTDWRSGLSSAIKSLSTESQPYKRQIKSYYYICKYNKSLSQT